MSQLWVKSQAEPRNMPVNLTNCHSISFINDPAIVAVQQKRADTYAKDNPTNPPLRVFNIFFYSGNAMSDEECVVQWQFAEYRTALAAYQNIDGLLGVMSV